MSVAAVVLAAGEASRFGSAKQALLLPGILARVEASGAIDAVVVVEGAHPLAGVALGDARLVRCEDWEVGPGASLRCGLLALDDAVEAAVVILADGPDLAPGSIARVVDHWRAHGGDVVAASYGGVRGHPVVAGRRAWGGIPDEGLRAVDPVLVACDDLGPPGDVDRPEDLPGSGRAPA